MRVPGGRTHLERLGRALPSAHGGRAGKDAARLGRGLLLGPRLGSCPRARGDGPCVPAERRQQQRQEARGAARMSARVRGLRGRERRPEVPRGSAAPSEAAGGSSSPGTSSGPAEQENFLRGPGSSLRPPPAAGRPLFASRHRPRLRARSGWSLGEEKNSGRSPVLGASGPAAKRALRPCVVPRAEVRERPRARLCLRERLSCLRPARCPRTLRSANRRRVPRLVSAPGTPLGQ